MRFNASGGKFRLESQVQWQPLLGGTHDPNPPINILDPLEAAGGAVLDGTSNVVFTTAGNLTTSIKLGGTSNVVFTTSGDLIAGNTSVDGTSNVVFTTSGSLTSSIRLVGTSSVVFTTSGNLTTGGAVLAGTSSVVFTTAGSLTSGIRLVGTSSVAFTTAGNLTAGNTSLDGASSVVFTAAGSLTSGIRLVGTSNVAFTTSGNLTSGMPLAGTSNVVFTAAGSLTSSIRLAGTSNVVFTTAGSLTSSIRLGGASSVVFSALGNLFDNGALDGTSNVVFNTSGNLTSGIPLNGTSNIVFSTSPADLKLISGTVGLYNTPLLSLALSATLSTPPILGSGSQTLQDIIGLLGPVAYGHSQENNYGLSRIDLDGISSYETSGYLENQGSVNNTLSNFNEKYITASFGGVSSSGTNFGSLLPHPLSDMYSFNTSGVQNYTQAGYFSKSLEGLLPTAVSGIEPTTTPSAHNFIFTKEHRKFIGRSCQILYLETVNNKIDTSCFVMVRPDPINLDLSALQFTVQSCACATGIPICLNRAHNEDVELYLRTSTYPTNITVSGQQVRPAVTGQDFYASSGIITIPSGSRCADFNFTLLNYTGDDVMNYFQVDVLYDRTHNICLDSPISLRVIIMPTGTGV